MALDRLALRAKYGEEEVYVVPYAFCMGIPDHYSAADKKLRHMFFGAVLPKGHFRLRAEAEGDPLLQQIIPYIVISNREGKYFVSERIKGDDRLVGQLSLGFGGHINPCDCVELKDRNAMLRAAMERELQEETSIKVKLLMKQPVVTGFVRNITSDLPDHLGVVYRADVGLATPEIREKDTLRGSWMTRRDMVLRINKFEPWAQFIIAALAFEG